MSWLGIGFARWWTWLVHDVFAAWNVPVSDRLCIFSITVGALDAIVLLLRHRI